MKKILFFLLIFQAAVFSVFPLEIVSSDTVLQGGVLTVIVRGAGEREGIDLVLSSGTSVVSKSKTFTADVNGNAVTVSLLGVPSTAVPGPYTIKAAAGDLEADRGLNVLQGSFIHEDIALSSPMSDLRQSDDIRKAEQWRNLLAILKTVDTGHVYQSGVLELPLESYIRRSSFFGDRRKFLYDDGTSARSIHNGIDYSAETGTPVYSAGEGRIVFSGERIISGNTVVIEHLPAVYALYFHLNSLSVKEGERVAAGDMIGTVGATGLVTGAHLHWEIRVAGVAVDPEPLMTGGLIDKALILSMMEGQ